MGRFIRRRAVVLGVVLALLPYSAFADGGNQAAIDGAKAYQAWLQTMTSTQQGIVAGQEHIANAKAIAQLLSYSATAQAQVPNATQQFVEFCDAVIPQLQAKVANAAAMATTRPWDPHAQFELANATAISHAFWDMIGTSYPGNPYVQTPYTPLYSEDAVDVALDDEEAMAADEMAVAAEDVLIADDALELT